MAVAIYVARELGKGSRVLVRGCLEIGEYTSRDGEQRTSYNIWANDVVNLTPPDGSPREDSPRGEPAAVAVRTSSRPAGRQRLPDGDLEDLPF